MDRKGAWLECLASFVWQILFEAQNHIDGSKSIWKEGFWVVSQELWVQWADVRLQAANRFVSIKCSVLVEIAVWETVAVPVIEAQVGVVRLWFWQGD